MDLQTRPEDLGKMGESIFISLCKQVGLIANTSDDDKGGWDVEIENVREQELNYSNHSYPVSRIQVKSSSKNKGKVRIEFSNLLNLIQYSGAAFILYFEYHSSNLIPDVAYLLEIDEDISRQVLIALRKRQISNKNFKINKNKYTVNFSNKQRLKSVEGHSLKLSLSNYIGENYNDYVIRKIEYLKSFEKENGKWGFTISLDNDKENISNFVDACLGYSSKFRASSEMYSTTMGVKDNKSINKQDTQYIALSPTEKDATQIAVSIGLEKYGKKLITTGKIYSTPEFLPIDVQKQRIKTDFFEVVFENKVVNSEALVKPNINFVDILNEEIITSVRNFELFLDIFNACSSYDRFYLTIGEGSASFPLEIQYTSVKLPEMFNSLYEAISSLNKKLIELNLDRDPISSTELLKKLNILSFHSTSSKDYLPSIQFEFKNEPTDKKETINLDPINMVIFSSKISFADKVLVSLVSFWGQVKKINTDKFLGNFNKSTHLKDLIFDKNTPDIDKLIDEEINRFKDMYVKDGYNPF